MKQKSFIWIIINVAFAALYAVEIPAGYTMPEVSGGVIFSDDFSGGLKNWVPGRETRDGYPRKDAYTVRQGAGENGSAGVVYERKNPREVFGYLRHYFNSKPGEKYRAQMRFKLENVKDPTSPLTRLRIETICAHHFDKNGKITGSFGWIEYPMHGKANQDWRTSEMVFTVPPNTVRTGVALLFHKRQTTGTVYYDNFVLERLGAQKALLYPVLPKQFEIGKDGKFLFRIYDYAGRDSKSFKLRLKIDGKVYDTAVKDDDMASLQIAVPAPGKYPCTVWLLDEKSKSVIGVEEYTFVVPDEKKALPEGSAIVAQDGTLKVDGKNYLPVGIYMGSEDLNMTAVKRIKEAGFNCVLPYYSMRLKIDPFSLAGSSAGLKKSLDILHENNLKILFCIKEQISGGVRKFGKASGSLNVGEYVAGKYGSHPAVLGWYITDENQPGDMPKVNELRRRVSAADPNHPVLTLTNNPGNHMMFGQTGDVLMVDAYPIYGPESKSMAVIRKHFPEGKKSSHLGIWFVPQTFHWGAYRQPGSAFRYPTAEEMRSMILLAMNCGAKGYVFYSYAPIFRKQEEMDPGSSAKFWPGVAAAAKLMRELEIFHFTTDNPKVTVENKGGNKVEARAYRADGRTAVVITCDGPGSAEAVLRIEGNTALRSRFGHTVRNADGSYTFKATDIGSDVLMQ